MSNVESCCTPESNTTLLIILKFKKKRGPQWLQSPFSLHYIIHILNKLPCCCNFYQRDSFFKVVLNRPCLQERSIHVFLEVLQHSGREDTGHREAPRTPRTPHTALRTCPAGSRPSGLLTAQRRPRRSAPGSYSQGFGPAGAQGASPQGQQKERPVARWRPPHLKRRDTYLADNAESLGSAAGSKRRAHRAQQRGATASLRAPCGRRAPRPPHGPAHPGQASSRGTRPPDFFRTAVCSPRGCRGRPLSRAERAGRRGRVKSGSAPPGGTQTRPFGRGHTQTPSGRGALPRASVLWGSLRTVHLRLQTPAALWGAQECAAPTRTCGPGVPHSLLRSDPARDVGPEFLPKPAPKNTSEGEKGTPALCCFFPFSHCYILF